jgi:hypothetical protein
LPRGEIDLEPIVIARNLERVRRAAANGNCRRRRIIGWNVNQDIYSPTTPTDPARLFGDT